MLQLSRRAVIILHTVNQNHIKLYKIIAINTVASSLQNCTIQKSDYVITEKQNYVNHGKLSKQAGQQSMAFSGQMRSGQLKIDNVYSDIRESTCVCELLARHVKSNVYNKIH